MIQVPTGAVAPFPFQCQKPLTSGWQVADDGTVICVEFGRLTIIRGAERQNTVLYPSEFPEQAVIDPAARVIVDTSRWSYPNGANLRIRAFDLSAGARWSVVEDVADFYQPILSDDGRLVLFLTNCRFDQSGYVGPAQAYVIGTDGKGMRRLTDDPAGIREAALSSNGKVAYAVTLSGRLLRIDVESREFTELLPRTLAVAFGAISGAAGSLIEFEGAGYPGMDGTPEPVTVRMGDMIAPVVSASPGDLVVQAPWELEGIRTKLTLTTEVPPSPFVPSAFEFEWPPLSWSPKVEPLPAEYGSSGADGQPASLALHSDSRIVDIERPARPGETIRVVATGVGLVDPAVPTGQAAPVEGPPSVVRIGLTCWT